MKIDGVTIAAGWTPTGDGGTKVAAADIEAAASIPLTKLESAVCSETEVLTIAATATLAASNTLRNSNDPERSIQSTTYVKLKEVKLNADLAACRIKFHLCTSKAGLTHKAFGLIYKNGVSTGQGTNTGSNACVDFSGDFADFVLNDLIRIYVKQEDAVETGLVSNMRFYYSEYVTHIVSKDLTTDLETEADPTISMTNQDP